AVRPGRTRWAVAVPPVPALGWTTLAPVGDPTGAQVAAPGGPAAPDGPAAPAPVPVVAAPDAPGGLAPTNGPPTIAVEDEGTLRLATADGLALGGLARLVDGGDGGDTYNFSPPAHDRLVDEPEAVTVTLAEEGPVRGRLVVTARYRWPTHA